VADARKVARKLAYKLTFKLVERIFYRSPPSYECLYSNGWYLI
jgi:hypothetical protein